MALSEKTLTKLREESEQTGSKVYYDDDVEAGVEDITRTDEDDDPLTLVGDLDGDGDVDGDDKKLEVGQV